MWHREAVDVYAIKDIDVGMVMEEYSAYASWYDESYRSQMIGAIEKGEFDSIVHFGYVSDDQSILPIRPEIDWS